MVQDDVASRQVNESIEIHDQLEDIQNVDVGESQLMLPPGAEDNINFEVSCNLDVLSNPSTEQIEDLKKESFQQVKSVSKKMEKVCVAPGEYGHFENWEKIHI